jgi:hypothetical protein
MRLPSVRKALIKLLVATSILAALILSCFIDSVGDARGLIVFFIVVLGFPITLLTGIDASRVIKREAPKHKSLAVLGRLLAFPQAVFGTILIGFSIVYPVFCVPEIIRDISDGYLRATRLFGLIAAAFGFGVGVHYLREGLGSKNTSR